MLLIIIIIVLSISILFFKIPNWLRKPMLRNPMLGFLAVVFLCYLLGKMFIYFLVGSMVGFITVAIVSIKKLSKGDKHEKA